MNTLAVHIVAVVFPEFELLDLYGPLELFGMMKERIKITVAADGQGL